MGVIDRRINTKNRITRGKTFSLKFLLCLINPYINKLNTNNEVTIAFIGEGEAISKNRIDKVTGREITQYIFAGKSLIAGSPTRSFKSKPKMFLQINIVVSEATPDIP